jgi:hypothetical protein
VNRYRPSEVLGVDDRALPFAVMHAYVQLAVVFEPERWRDHLDLHLQAVWWRELIDEAYRALGHVPLPVRWNPPARD